MSGPGPRPGRPPGRPPCTGSRSSSFSRSSTPATTGDPVFERTFRVHQNTLEQLPVFLVGIALFAHYVSAGIAALLGVVFLVGRALYASGYIRDPGERGRGFLLTVASEGILVVGGLLGAIGALL